MFLYKKTTNMLPTGKQKLYSITPLEDCRFWSVAFTNFTWSLGRVEHFSGFQFFMKTLHEKWSSNFQIFIQYTMYIIHGCKIKALDLGQLHLPHLWICNYLFYGWLIHKFQWHEFSSFFENNWQKMKKNIVMEIYGWVIHKVHTYGSISEAGEFGPRLKIWHQSLDKK